MATVRARTFRYGVTLDREWTAASDRGGAPLANEEATWTPEHLLLTALARCVLTSLGHHAGRAGVAVASSAEAAGTVTRRDEDGRFAFIEIEVDAAVDLEPAQPAAAARDLVARAERDCFVAASLAVTPAYRWTVDGAPLG